MAKNEIEIIYQDDDIIVVNKPAGVSVTKDRSGKKQLLGLLAGQLGPRMCGQHCGELAEPLRLIHRLDKDTSGAMILAKNVESQRKFSNYFEKRIVKKTYLAFVAGVVRNQTGVIDAPLAPNPDNPQLMRIDRKNGKEAVTEWRLLADFGLAALLAVSPLTGRTHQIRVHLLSIGLPLAVDPLYGGSRGIFLSDFKTDYRLGKWQEEKPLIDRLTLHSYQIVIPAEPVLSGPVLSLVERVEGAGIHPDCFIAGLDKKFAAALKMLAKHNPKGPSVFLDPSDFDKIIRAERLD